MNTPILLADAGGTKTHWALVQAEQTLHTWQAAGLNPYLLTDVQLAEKLTDQLEKSLNGQPLPTALYFYGAGCRGLGATRMAAALQRLFPSAHVHVESDLLGAALALFGRGEGIACILGTGANSCHYAQGKIVQQVPALGYLLGDEASGAVLGAELLKGIFKRRFSPELCRRFHDTYALTLDELLERTYRQPAPNRFLASFAPFVLQHKDMPELQALIATRLQQFFNYNLTAYPAHLPLGFVGGIAFRLQEEIACEAARHQRQVSCFLSSPMEGLLTYHQQEGEVEKNC